MGDIGDFPNTFNNSGSLYSLCSSDGKLKIWDTSNNILKQECVRTSHLNSCCTCLIWIQVTKHVSDAMCLTLIKTNLITIYLSVFTLKTVVLVYNYSLTREK